MVKQNSLLFQKLSQLSIRKKLLFGTAFLFVVFLLNIVVNFWENQQTVGVFQEFDHNSEHLEVIHRLRDLVSDQRIRVYVHLGNTLMDEMENLREDISLGSTQIDEMLKQLEVTMIDSDSEKELIDQISEQTKTYLIAIDETVALSEDFAKEDGYVKANTIDKKLFDRNKSLLNELADIASTHVKKKGTQALNQQEIALYVVLIFGIISLAVISGLWVVINQVVRRIHYLVQTAQHLAQGDLTVKVAIESDDELGTLGRNLDTMRVNLHTLVDKMGDAAMQLSSSTNDISAMSQQQVHAIGDQTTVINQFSASLNEMAATSNELGRNMSAIVDIVRHTIDLAQEGTSSIDSSLSSMDNIKQANEVTETKFSILMDKVETIAKVLTTITSIADKTNLLSVNASIEAVKAGEFGKGFGVVASEIRRLADQTMIASQEISDMISEIQKASNASMMSMEKSSMTTKEGVTAVAAAGQSINDLVESVQDVGPRMEEMQEATAQQSEGTLMMTQVVKQIQEASVSHKVSAEQNSRTAMVLLEMAKEQLGLVQSFIAKPEDHWEPSAKHEEDQNSLDFQLPPQS